MKTQIEKSILAAHRFFIHGNGPISLYYTMIENNVPLKVKRASNSKFGVLGVKYYKPLDNSESDV